MGKAKHLIVLMTIYLQLLAAGVLNYIEIICIFNNQTRLTMKRLFISLLPLFFIPFIMNGNVAPPRVYLSEILFESSGDWTIETILYGYLPEDIDSIRLVSSTGSSLVSYCTYTMLGDSSWWNFISVIGDTNLSSPLTVDPAGDYIKLVTYSFGYYITIDSVAFGNFPGSYLDCSGEGESYAYVSYQQHSGWTGSFTLDISPTIGLPNDTTGALSAFQGMVYDPDGEPFTDGYFKFVVTNLWIYIQPDGSFNERIFARRYNCSQIDIRFPPSPPTVVSYYIQPMDFCLRPDTLHQADFITTGYVGVAEKEKNYDHALIVSPNPFHNHIAFYPDWKSLPEENEYLLTIIDTRGQKVHEVKLSSSETRYDWQPSPGIPSGIFIYSLSGKHGVYAGGKVIKR